MTTYKRSMSSIGVGMLFFILFYNILSFLVVGTELVLSAVGVPEIPANIIYYTVYGVGYLCTFFFPAFIIKKRLQKMGAPASPVQSDWRLSPYLPLLILAGTALVFSCSLINNFMVETFHYNEGLGDLMGVEDAGDPYVYALLFFQIGVVPGICEEYLFRGVILENLRPYGKSTALIVSSALFAVMHQNVGQIFYAFCAGLLFGMIYLKTGNIWNTSVMHIFNNTVSLLSSVVAEYAGERAAYLFQIALFVLGAAAALVTVILWLGEKKKKQNESSLWGENAEENTDVPLISLQKGEAVKGFFRPSMIAFLALALVQIGSLIIMSQTGGLGLG